MKIRFVNFHPGNVAVVERSLRAEAHRPPVPAGLHDSIMNAVQHQVARTAPERSSRSIAWLWRLSVPAAAACVLLALLVYRVNLRKPHTSDGVALSEPAETLTLGQSLPQFLPTTLAALSDELNGVQKDLDETANFLTASIP